MKIAFASCSSITRQDGNQPIWGIIHAQKPDMLLLLGDNVYIGKQGYDEEVPEKTKRLRGKYIKQLAEPHFNKLICDVPFLPIWDNHDYGLPGHQGDHDVTFGAEIDPLSGHHEMAQKLFNIYLRDRSLIPTSDTTYYKYEKDGIKFLMLDVRSKQQNPEDSNAATLLGQDQVDWLFNELNGSQEITIVCSGLAYSFGGMCWKDHVNWYEAFGPQFASAPKPLFIGGNVHSNRFRMHTHHPIETSLSTLIPGIQRPELNNEKLFYEVISSGVGGNFGGPPRPGIDESDQDDADTIFFSREVFGGMFDNLPRNNYGMIDIGPDKVKVCLYSQMPALNYYAVIDRQDWSLKKLWQMGEPNYEA